MSDVTAQVGQSLSWKDVDALDRGIELIDRGVLLAYPEAKSLGKRIDQKTKIRLIQQLGSRFSERIEDRLAQEILVESFLNIMIQETDETLLQGFLESLFTAPEPSKNAIRFAEIALMLEYTDEKHSDSLRALAVSCVCELGMAVKAAGEHYPDSDQSKSELLAHITTYLVSLSNSDNACIRLSLFHYFGSMESDLEHKPGFSKVMSRFGHTLLDQLFGLLFQKKTEAVALQYMNENLPFVLASDRYAQQILHETMRYYMLKKPDRFGLFMQTFATSLGESKSLEVDVKVVSKVFMQHCLALLRVASELNHRELGGELLSALTKFSGHPARPELIVNALAQNDLRKPFRDLLEELRKHPERHSSIDRIHRFSHVKRGRKPSFSKSHQMESVRQIAFLGVQTIEDIAS